MATHSSTLAWKIPWMEEPGGPQSMVSQKVGHHVGHFTSVAKSYPTLAILWTVARQVPLPMGFPRQEYWSELPFPSPGDLPRPGIKPGSLALAGRFFTAEPPGKPLWATTHF